MNDIATSAAFGPPIVIDRLNLRALPPPCEAAPAQVVTSVENECRCLSFVTRMIIWGTRNNH
ncbi:MAG: hypothetical protein ACRYG4_23490 [Janthinobacterium lividum]